MFRVKVKIKGTTPLLMNKWNQELAEARTDRPEFAEKRLYKNDKGEIVVPAEWIERAIMKVAKDFKVEGQRKITYALLLPGNVIIRPEFIKIEPQKWVIDARTVVIPSTGGRVMRYRPKFENWSLEFSIDVIDERIKPETLQKILVDAGRRVGIGDGRSIGFGRFMIEKYEVQESE